MSGDLPKGWAEVSLSSVVYFQEGPGLRKWQFGEDGIPFLNIRTFENGRVNRSKCQFVKLEEFKGKYEHFLLNDGDLVVSSSGTLGKVATIQADDLPLMLNTSTIRFRAHYPDVMSQKFLQLYVQSDHFFRQIESAKTGSAILNYGPSHLKQMNIVLAPFAEQKRIVAKVEKLLEKVNASRARLEKIPALLKRFRQAVLDAAVTGKLTADWRTKPQLNCDAIADLKDYLHSSQLLRPRTREAESTEGHDTLIDELPAEWTTASLDELFRFIDYRGKTPIKSEGGKRLISAKNIKMGYISEEPIEYVSDIYYRQWMTRGFPKPGDIFFVTEGHTMGFAALNNRTDEFALSQRTITLQPWRPIDSRPFFYFIMSPSFQNLVRVNATGSAAVGIKAAKFRGLPMPFPSFPEQAEIVRRVEELFALADRLEARVGKARGQVDKLTQSILAKAFRGELVPQDPNDEPAEKLLERIRASAGPVAAQGGKVATTSSVRRGRPRKAR